jgi:hypothetical protein
VPSPDGRQAWHPPEVVSQYGLEEQHSLLLLQAVLGLHVGGNVLWLQLKRLHMLASLKNALSPQLFVEISPHAPLLQTHPATPHFSKLVMASHALWFCMMFPHALSAKAIPGSRASSTLAKRISLRNDAWHNLI